MINFYLSHKIQVESKPPALGSNFVPPAHVVQMGPIILKLCAAFCSPKLTENHSSIQTQHFKAPSHTAEVMTLCEIEFHH